MEVTLNNIKRIFMNFLDYLNESYYNKELKSFFEKILNCELDIELNRSEEDIFIVKNKTVNELKEKIDIHMKKISNHVNRMKNPVYSISLIKNDNVELSIKYITEKFRKKYIFHATHSSNVASILKDGILKQDARRKDYIKTYDDAIVYILYRGSFFFGARSLALKYGTSIYGNECVVLKIDNSTGKYNDSSFYEPESKEKYGYSHSFFIINNIDPEDIHIV